MILKNYFARHCVCVETYMQQLKCENYVTKVNLRELIFKD